MKLKPAHLLTLLRSDVLHILICFFCRAGTAITVKTIHLWWQYVVHKINWIWPWFILLYVSLHIISLSSILHGYDVLTYLASRIFGTYLVIYVFPLITINYASNHSSMIAPTKIYSSIIGLLSASLAYLLVRCNILQRPYFWRHQIPSFLYGALRFFFLICIHRSWTRIEFHPSAPIFWTWSRSR